MCKKINGKNRRGFIVNQPIPTTFLSIVLFYSSVCLVLIRTKGKKKGEEMKQKEIAKMVKIYCIHVVAYIYIYIYIYVYMYW